MNPNTQRGLTNAMDFLFQSPEFDRLRLFLVADGNAAKPEGDEIIRHICDEVRAHLLTHQKAVLAAKRGL